ncbi:Transcription factor CP2-like protein 1 [Araneus ventricosus]|uniref:Transcription factor CP2-like protein 1 n=1 Tax=Araneus ventricosus TaxID=182803 RepID=A0A4Y2X2Q7_ARAVE|nr:Transcription factor CP2-like protein 1 [Araneus ventricosus]
MFQKLNGSRNVKCERNRILIRSAKQASAASASNYYSVENEGETEIEDVMEVEMKEYQEGTKDRSYSTFASKSFQQPTLSVQMRLKLDKTALAIWCVQQSHGCHFIERYTRFGFNIGIRHQPGNLVMPPDVPLSYGLLEAVNSSTNINECEFVWDPTHDIGVFLKVNCISTEFTAKKHGGEKGVPFRIVIDTYSVNNQSEKLHSASCQVKVFKPKGADRKHKTDREKMCKRLQSDKEKYHPQYDYTIFRDVS